MAASLQELATRTRPVSLAGDERLPVVDALARLLPGGGLRRGSTITVTGSTSLALALLVAATAERSWCAAAGLPALGLAAAAEMGVALDRLALVPDPGAANWATVTAALLDAFAVVLVSPPARMRPADARRLTAKARERKAVLVSVGKWAEGADVRLSVAASRWEGLGNGHGHLQRRRVDVIAQGRGAAARQQQIQLWIPDGDGRISVAEQTAVETDVPSRRLSVAG